MNSKKEIKTNSSMLSYSNRDLSVLGSAPSIIAGVYSSLMYGLAGFGIVLILITISKLLSFSMGVNEFFIIESHDITISFWGFIVFSFSVFVKKNKIREKS